VLLWRWIWSRRLKRAPLAMPWMVILAVAWMVGPWVDEIWGSWVFKRACEAMPEDIYNIPVAVGVGEFYDEHGNRRLWSYQEIRAGKSPHSPDDLPFAVDEDKKFMAAFEREFVKSRNDSQIMWLPIPIVERVAQRVHRTSGVVVWKTWLVGSSGGWVKRLFGWGSHAPYTCVKPAKLNGKTALFHDYIKFK
jgi:hypothetical protein